MLLTPFEAAKELAISERTLWALTKEGKLRCVRINKWTKRYDPADLAAWIEAQKTQPAPVRRNMKVPA